LDTAAILKLFKEAVQKQQIKISLHAAEQALAEYITRPEIEAALLSALYDHHSLRTSSTQVAHATCTWR